MEDEQVSLEEIHELGQLREEALLLLGGAEGAVDLCAAGGAVSRGTRDTMREKIARERGHVKELRTSVAVVGPVNSGKSSWINAVTGFLLMPLNALPLTSIPTAVYHAPGLRQPVLSLPHVNSFREAISDIYAKLQLLDKDAPFSFGDPSLDRVLDLVRQEGAGLLGKPSKDAGFAVEGEGPAYRGLRLLNDIVRVCGSPAFVQCRDPLRGLTRLEHFPRIHVEFAALGGRETRGQLVMVDSPGPDEARKSPRMLGLMQRVLEATTVRVVLLDGTLLTRNVSRVVLEASGVASLVDAEDTYVVVNKIDQLESREIGEQEEEAWLEEDDPPSDEDEPQDMEVGISQKHKRVLEQVVGELGISPQRVFPVSARYALLAHAGLGFVNKYGKPPPRNATATSWVAELYKEAYGTKVQMDRVTRDDFITRCKALWTMSNIGESLSNIVQHLFTRAAPNALAHAASTLQGCGASLQKPVHLLASIPLHASGTKAIAGSAHYVGDSWMEWKRQQKKVAEHVLGLVEAHRATLRSLRDSIEKELATRPGTLDVEELDAVLDEHYPLAQSVQQHIVEDIEKHIMPTTREHGRAVRRVLNALESHAKGEPPVMEEEDVGGGGRDPTLEAAFPPLPVNVGELLLRSEERGHAKSLRNASAISTGVVSELGAQLDTFAKGIRTELMAIDHALNQAASMLTVKKQDRKASVGRLRQAAQGLMQLQRRTDQLADRVHDYL